MFRHVFPCPQGRCLALAAGAVFSFTARRGERVHCRGGRILLSQFKVVEDFDLAGGDAVVVQRQGMVVIEAVEASVLMLESGVAEKYLQQLVQVALAAQRRAHMLRRHFQQLLTLRRQ
jgi:hypothetical protein